MTITILSSTKRPRFRKKLAMFDFDWTLVKPESGHTLPLNREDWKWLYPGVLDVLKKLYRSGNAIVIFTNQTKEFKHGMIEDVIGVLEKNGILSTAVILNGPDKKPSISGFNSYIDNVTVSKQKSVGDFDLKKSMYVGDAAGRPGDWSDVDKLFCDAVNVFAQGRDLDANAPSFRVPEEVFLTSDMLNKPDVSPLPKTADQLSEDLDGRHINELVYTVGFPGSGKSTFVGLHFDDKTDDNYVILNSDAFKSNYKRMFRTAESHLESGKSVVLDGAFGTREKRALIHEIARKTGAMCRCFWITADMKTAISRNNIRALQTGQKVPEIAIRAYNKRFQPPEATECEFAQEIGFKVDRI